jgi:uncharacterized protein
LRRLGSDLWATANTFRRGHRIRVAVTSSSSPRFDRNLNTGGPVGAEAVGQVALNTVFHDAVRPRRVVLSWPVTRGLTGRERSCDASRS